MEGSGPESVWVQASLQVCCEKGRKSRSNQWAQLPQIKSDLFILTSNMLHFSSQSQTSRTEEYQPSALDYEVPPGLYQLHLKLVSIIFQTERMETCWALRRLTGDHDKSTIIVA